ncbi:MAG: response regulator [Desulforhopalus sp.]|nr:response regulator [Desulforhopalus sp.]
MQSVEKMNKSSVVSLLIVDDSLVFRKFLGDIFDECEGVVVVGEAQNGIEALDMVLKTKPDVILLDLEMPLMDGMTALQHLMIHRPTPTIMFSSLTEKGTARCFDTMKNGAVDFVCKDFIFQKSSLLTYKKLLIEKVQNAALVKIKAKEPVYAMPTAVNNEPEVEQRVVFCEECGNREIVAVIGSQPIQNTICSQCGDTIDFSLFAQSKYRQNTFITVLGGGEGSFTNLLQIVPQLGADIGGALIAVVHQDLEYVNGFAEYLDAISAIKVIRAREGVNVEGGNCYIASGSDYMSIKPYSAQLTLQKVPKGSLKGGPLDILLTSASTAFKKRAAGIILSGDESDGERGMSILIKNGGIQAILNEDECYCKNMGRQIVKKCNLSKSSTLDHIVETIKKTHYHSKYDTITG